MQLSVRTPWPHIATPTKSTLRLLLKQWTSDVAQGSLTRLWYWGSDLERSGWSISHNALFGLVSYNDFCCWSPRYYMWIVDHCTRGKERLCRWQRRYFLLVRNHPFQVQWKLSILRFGLAAQTPFFDKKFETPEPLCTVVSNIYIYIFMSMICIYIVS